MTASSAPSGREKNVAPAGARTLPVDAIRPRALQALVQEAKMPMTMADPAQPDHPIVSCNAAFEALTGYRREEIIGRNGRFLQGTDTDPATVAVIKRDLALGRPSHVDILNYRKDGTAFWNALSINPVRDEDQRICYFVAMQRDVTLRRPGATVEPQRLALLGALTSSLAHQFNDLLTIMMGSHEQLHREVESERGRRLLGRAEWGLRQAALLTKQVIALAEHGHGVRTPLELGSAVAAFSDILRRTAGSHVEVELHRDDGEITARLDRGRLELALFALIRHAVASMPQGGKIVIRTRALRVADLIAILAPHSSRQGMADAKGAWITDNVAWGEVVVEDDGPGLDAELARLLNEDHPPSGTMAQVGLAMVAGFVRESGGWLAAETGPARGTRIHMLFPLVADPA